MHYHNEALEKDKWRIYKSSVILENKDLMDAHLEVLHRGLLKHLGRLEDPEGVDTTWLNGRYNFFAASQFQHPVFMLLWEEVVDVIRQCTPPEVKYVWVQSWLNYDTQDTVEVTLKPHTHSTSMQGYISISPGKTKTVFEDWEIVNEVGNIFMGQGKWIHHVENTGKYDAPRTTIGLDVIFGDDPGEGWDAESYIREPWHYNWIPLVL
jgi:hypothetical protein